MLSLSYNKTKGKIKTIMTTTKDRNKKLRELINIYNKKHFFDNNVENKLKENIHFRLEKTYFTVNDSRLNQYGTSSLFNFLNNELKQIDWYIDEEKYTKLNTFYTVGQN